MALDNLKYVVFKREEFTKFTQDLIEHQGDRDFTIVNELGDAVVIRLQDVFAGPGLYAYANAIQTGLELDMLADECGMDDEDRSRLEEIRDYFVTMADRAEKVLVKKLPD